MVRELQYIMRLILTLLLLLQLDPLLGAALCLQREAAPSQECTMPQPPAPSERTVAAAGDHLAGACSVAQLCAQPAPALTVGENALLTSLIPSRTQPLLEQTKAPSESPTPLFHPPRV